MTPPDRERRAREEALTRRILDEMHAHLMNGMRGMVAPGLTELAEKQFAEAMDSHESAIRATREAEIRERVEGMRDEHNHWCAGWKAYTMHELDCDCGGREHNAVLDRVLTALAVPPEEQTDGK